MAYPRKYPKLTVEVGIYGIHNVVTDKWYVGSSLEMTKRWRRHLWELRNGRHHSEKLQRSYDKHGEASFELVVLQECSPDALEALETAAITRLNSVSQGYNIAAEAKGGFMRGRQWPEGTKEARVEAMRGFKHTEESKRRIKETLASRSEEDKALQRERIGNANRKPKSVAGAANIAAASLRRQRDQSPEMREARRQNVLKGHATRKARREAEQQVCGSLSEEVTYC